MAILNTVLIPVIRTHAWRIWHFTLGLWSQHRSLFCPVARNVEAIDVAWPCPFSVCIVWIPMENFLAISCTEINFHYCSNKCWYSPVICSSMHIFDSPYRLVIRQVWCPWIVAVYFVLDQMVLALWYLPNGPLTVAVF